MCDLTVPKSSQVFKLMKSVVVVVQEPLGNSGNSGDEEGHFFLDFNPQCFSMVVEYLRNRRLRPDAPLPVIPQVQKRNMELLAEAWILGQAARTTGGCRLVPRGCRAAPLWDISGNETDHDHNLGSNRMSTVISIGIAPTKYILCIDDYKQWAS